MLPTLRQEIEAHIQSLGFEQQKPTNLYAPMAYILSLPGKRIRPLLTLAAYRICSLKPATDALDLACAMEIFHNFTLVHDDIMDNAPTRRGKPTVHEKWDNNVAILSGDTLLAIAYEMIARNFPQYAATLIPLFSRHAVAVCEGQMEDMDLATQAHTEISDYIEMIRKKTSVLIGACLELGAIAGGANAEAAKLFYDFGEKTGLAFQLQDDLMDAFPPENFGKQVGGDIIENKKTYLWLRVQEKANEAQLARFQALANSTNMQDKVAGICALYQELEIPQDTEAQIQHYFNQAKKDAEELAKHYDMSLMNLLLNEIAGRKI